MVDIGVMRERRESIEQRADDCVKRWEETHRRHCAEGQYNYDTGLWVYKEPHRVTAAFYALDAYRDAGKMVGDLAQMLDEALNELELLRRNV